MENTQANVEIPRLGCYKRKVIIKTNKNEENIGKDVVGNTSKDKEDIDMLQEDYDMPNLICGSNYALNNSNSKSLTAGISLCGKEFVISVQILGASSKVINFDFESWMKFTSHFDTISAYFGDSVTYKKLGNPVKIYHSGFDICFTTSYNKKPILIEERPPNNKNGTWF